VGRAANRLLVEAHLAMAVEIARGAWEQKMDTVPRWIERASALAEGVIAEDESQLHLRLKVAVSALAAAASLEKPIDPLLWIEEAEQTAKLMRKLSTDPLIHDQIDWKLGLAYFQAAQIEHRRSAPESALRLGKLADAKLIDLAKGRDELPDTAYLMGRLYFQIGVVHAVHENDHTTACEWYDEAADRLLNPVPVTTMANPQQHGDALVSMGVSYWETGSRGRAIEITESGVKLIEHAVESGLLTPEALVIPYSNLAAMYEGQGETEPAAMYTELAQKVARTKR
jgi:tetratricopeptide (TPR) repeat protein